MVLALLSYRLSLRRRGGCAFGNLHRSAQRGAAHAGPSLLRPGARPSGGPGRSACGFRHVNSRTRYSVNRLADTVPRRCVPIRRGEPIRLRSLGERRGCGSGGEFPRAGGYGQSYFARSRRRRRIAPFNGSRSFASKRRQMSRVNASRCLRSIRSTSPRQHATTGGAGDLLSLGVGSSGRGTSSTVTRGGERWRLTET